MGKNHKKISVTEREEIFLFVKEGRSIREIARFLQRSSSTISEELRRKGMTRETYSLAEAQVDRNIKASLKGRKSKLQEGKNPLKIIKKWLLNKKWSPEQISGRLKLKFRNDAENQVSY